MFKMQRLEVSCAVRHIYIYIYICVCVCVFSRLRVKHNASDAHGAVEIQFQEFLSWTVDPDGQLYNPDALCTEQ
jgi:hypothetical protein